MSPKTRNEFPSENLKNKKLCRNSVRYLVLLSLDDLEGTPCTTRPFDGCRVWITNKDERSKPLS